ncbi:MerR family transcriptional regulator [Actinoallomurus liliacearum]
MKSSGSMSIGEVAERFGLATHVLRHWESMGLLEPVRAAGGRRRYTTDDLYRVAIILRAKEAGLGLEDIRRMLAVRRPAERRAILEGHRRELTERIARERASLRMIEAALDCDHEDFTRCPHFQAVLTERLAPTGTPGPGAGR